MRLNTAQNTREPKSSGRTLKIYSLLLALAALPALAARADQSHKIEPAYVSPLK